ncbi:MAG: hypothetical protein CM1200mP2_34630 [Planctomycetaceae bacterium]|nr:MAG: hypothetical protein CM1200mP2_34630 [Planctomycetaceae bacterium]
MPEIRIELDDQGQVEDVHQVVHDESHQVIEDSCWRPTWRLRRSFRIVGGVPAAGSSVSQPVETQAICHLRIGTGISAGSSTVSSALQKLIDSASAGPLSHAVNYALLRSFKQAEYTGRQEALRAGG